MIKIFSCSYPALLISSQPGPADMFSLTARNRPRAQPHAEAIAAKRRSLWLLDAESKKYSGPARRVDLKGKTFLPVFVFALHSDHRRAPDSRSGERYTANLLAKSKNMSATPALNLDYRRVWIETFWKPPVFRPQDWTRSP